MSKIWFVTGSSRGLGRAIVDAALAAGDTVVATARDTSTLPTHPRLVPLVLDVTDAAGARTAVASAVAKLGRIDVVVNNAGRGFLGAFEEQSDVDFAEQIDLNFWGTVNVVRAVLPTLRAQRSGHLINVTSVGGRAGAPGLSGYQASKFATEGLTEVLWHELKPLGIRVTAVEPGGFRTDWAGASMRWAEPIPDYQAVRDWRELVSKRAGYELGDPVRGARAIVALANLSDPPLRLPLGSDAYAFLKLTYESNLAELERTKELTLSTDFPDATSNPAEVGKLFDRTEH